MIDVISFPHSSKPDGVGGIISVGATSLTVTGEGSVLMVGVSSFSLLGDGSSPLVGGDRSISYKPHRAPDPETDPDPDHEPPLPLPLPLLDFGPPFLEGGHSSCSDPLLLPLPLFPLEPFVALDEPLTLLDPGHDIGTGVLGAVGFFVGTGSGSVVGRIVSAGVGDSVIMLEGGEVTTPVVGIFVSMVPDVGSIVPLVESDGIKVGTGMLEPEGRCVGTGSVVITIVGSIVGVPGATVGAAFARHTVAFDIGRQSPVHTLDPSKHPDSGTSLNSRPLSVGHCVEM